MVNFIDFKKAFDNVHRETLWKIVQSYGVPEKFVSIFKNLCEESSCCVKIDSGYTAFFNIITGVRQGCLLSPLLFAITIDFVMRNCMGNANFEIKWKKDERLTDLDFTDDIALLAENMADL